MKNLKRQTRNAKPETGRPTPKMNAAARVASWRTNRNAGDNKGYRPNPRRAPSDGTVWRQKPL